MAHREITSSHELDDLISVHWSENDDEEPDPAGVFHARAILSKTYPADPSAVYAISDNDEMIAIATVVHAQLPRTTGHTLRVISVILAPKFGIHTYEHARLERAFAITIFEMVVAAREKFPSIHVKIYFGGQADRNLISPIRRELEKLTAFRAVDFHGQWLNVTLNNSQ